MIKKGVSGVGWICKSCSMSLSDLLFKHFNKRLHAKYLHTTMMLVISVTRAIAFCRDKPMFNFVGF